MSVVRPRGEGGSSYWKQKRSKTFETRHVYVTMKAEGTRFMNELGVGKKSKWQLPESSRKGREGKGGWRKMTAGRGEGIGAQRQELRAGGVCMGREEPRVHEQLQSEWETSLLH